MNDSPLPMPTVPVPSHLSPRPYQAPALTDLGTIEAVTAGPDKSPEKHLDMIIGSDGGFFAQDATS